MSENNQGATLPACWNAAVFPQGESWAWVAWQDGNKFSRMQGGATTEALAWDGARKMIDEQQKPPAPPAWMVEVAREAVALHYEDRGSPSLAASTRAGGEDEAGPIINCVRTLRLALERGHVVVPREWTEEELLKAAREDVRKLNAILCPNFAQKVADGRADYHEDVQCALQARRNMLKEGAVAAPAAPSVDLEAALKRAWDAGYSTSFGRCRDAVMREKTDDRDRQTAIILASLPTREA